MQHAHVCVSMYLDQKKLIGFLAARLREKQFFLSSALSWWGYNEVVLSRNFRIWCQLLFLEKTGIFEFFIKME